MNKKRLLMVGNIREYSMIVALVAIVILFGFLTKGLIFTPVNISNLIMQNAYIILLSIGMCLCLVTGNFDLSAGSVVGMASASLGIIIVRYSGNPLLAMLVGLIVGILAGFLQSLIIAYIHVSPFIVTLAGQMIFRGVIMVLMKGQSLGPFPENFQKIATGFIFPNLKIADYNAATIIAGIVVCLLYLFLVLRSRANRRRHNLKQEALWSVILKAIVVITVVTFISYSLASHKGMPIVLAIVGVATAIYAYITTKTKIGRYLYAIGGNENAARLSGIDVEKIKVLVFVNMGFIAAITGFLVTLRLNAAIPGSGEGFEMDAITACVIGGVSTSGGSGKITGVIVGSLVVAVLANGMSIMGMGTDAQKIIKGLVLLAAVTFDVISKTKASRS